eukprot:g36405.t1
MDQHEQWAQGWDSQLADLQRASDTAFAALMIWMNQLSSALTGQPDKVSEYLQLQPLLRDLWQASEAEKDTPAAVKLWQASFPTASLLQALGAIREAVIWASQGAEALRTLKERLRGMLPVLQAERPATAKLKELDKNYKELKKLILAYDVEHWDDNEDEDGLRIITADLREKRTELAAVVKTRQSLLARCMQLVEQFPEMLLPESEHFVKGLQNLVDSDGRLVRRQGVQVIQGKRLDANVEGSQAAQASGATGHRPDAHAQAMMREVLRGVEHIHRLGVVHCGLKPANIFLAQQADSSWQPKIGDFDVSMDTGERTTWAATVAATTARRGFAGTLNYVAPEVFQGQRASFASDMFSFGLILFDVHFPGSSACRPSAQLLLAGHAFSPPSHSNQQLRKLLESLLQRKRQQLEEQESKLQQEIATERKRLEEQGTKATKQQKERQSALLKQEEALAAQRAELVAQDRSRQKKEQQMKQQLQNLQRKDRKMKEKQEALEQKKKELLECQVLAAPPVYWASRSLRLDQPCRLVDPKELEAQVQELMTNTCISRYIGIGSDSHGLRHTGFRVVRVQRVENPQLWSKYQIECEAVRANMPRPPAQVTLVDSYNRALWKRLQVDFGVHEALLWHGTKADFCELIAKQGLDERLANNGLFGHGIYFAENSSKSDEYIEPDRQGNCYIFLARVCLGVPHSTLHRTNGMRRPHCAARTRPCCTTVRAECKGHAKFRSPAHTWGATESFRVRPQTDVPRDTRHIPTGLNM